MNQYFGLINTISKDFNITKGIEEPEKKWKARIIYSYLGQVGLASLFDSQEDLTPASIIHFKTRILDTLSSILVMYPELDGLFASDDQTLCDEIYNIFINTGCIYHEPNRITPCTRKEAKGNSITFLRGQSVGEHRCLSGLGCYSKNLTTSDEISIADMFLLQSDTVEEYWKKTIAHSRFTDMSAEIKFEYLRVSPPFSRGYWGDKPDLSGDVSIARTGMPGSRIYYLYKIQNATMQVAQLPNWQTDGFQYRSLAVGNLYTKRVLPETMYHIDGELVTLRIGYLFPPDELNLIKLYSWPLSYIAFPHDFSRMMVREVFEELRVFFEFRGYCFKEE